ncbi:MAG TPA: zinc dependent phospholipase C family protein [Clostridiaceae bacterium]|nr:zinc dependent phospholipase C family protein [Clostridiaceae bacterium]
MADFLTHIILADEVVKRIESRRIYEGVNKKRSLYHLGAQGPDPLFFYDCFPGRGKGALKELGDVMHEERTGAFLLKGFGKLQDVSYDKRWMNIAIYMCGFICHFTLDRLLHPYVFWAADQWIWGVDGTPVTVTHMQVETALDVIYWREKKGRHAYKEKTSRLVYIGKHWPEGVSDFLIEAFRDIYGMEVSEKELNKILRDFYRGHDLLYDPKGWKKALVHWLENLTGGGIKPPKYPYPVEPDDTVDWTNKKKRTWVNPFVKGDTWESSVAEILEEAADTAANHINTVFRRIFSNEGIDDLFPNLSYTTGIQCE